MPAAEELSPESIVTLCLLVGWRQTCTSGPFPRAMGVRNCGLSQAWVCWLGCGHLPRHGQQQEIPRAALKHVRVPSLRWEEVLVLRGGFERSFCHAHPTIAALPAAWAVSPCALHPSVGLAARSVPGRGTTSAALCPFPSSWPLHGAVLGACSAAEQTPRSPAPVCVPHRGAHAVCSVRSVLTRNKEIPVVCRNGKNPDCCKIN